MASPKSIIFLTFLLAALEMARSLEDYRCKTKEDCSGKVGCIQVVGEELTCAGGTCACVRANSIVGPALNVKNILPFPNPTFPVPGAGGPRGRVPCNTDEDCSRRSISVRCLDIRATCHEGGCVCSSET